MGYRIFPVLNFPNRMISTWVSYIWPTVRIWISGLFKSREDGNFTYALTKRCQINYNFAGAIIPTSHPSLPSSQCDMAGVFFAEGPADHW
jgi:hypothetical protein